MTGGRSRIARTSILIVTLLIAGVINSSHAAETDSVYTADMSHADSVAAWQEAVDNTTVLDATGNVIGDVVFFPFDVLFTGVGATAGFVNSQQVIPKLDDLLSSEDGRWRLVPVYSNRNGAGGKLKFKPDPEGDIQIYVMGSGWLYGRQHYEAAVKEFVPQGGPTLDAVAAYSILPEERFYGFGMTTRESDRMFYKHEVADFNLEVGLTNEPGVRFSVYGGYSVHNIRPGAFGPDLTANVEAFASELVLKYKDLFDLLGVEFDIPLPPELRSTSRLGEVGLHFDVNTLENPARPRTGRLLAFDASYHGDGEDNGFQYMIYKGKFGQYLHIANDRVLYADIEGELVDDAGDSNPIPLWDYRSLGGGDNLRGFVRDRYRGEGLVAGTVEYRFPLRDIWGESGLDFSLFADWGRVYGDTDAEEIEGRMQIGYGFGLAGWNIDGSAVRFDVGFSREGVQAYLTMGL